MTDLNQYRVQWTGLTGLPGVSTFYSTGAPGPLLAKLRTFFESIVTSIPSGISIIYPGTGNVIDSATGRPKASWAVTAPAKTNATGTGNYAAPVGAVVDWTTALYAGGRRIAGKTFLVPLVGGAFDGTGHLNAANVTNFSAAATTVCGGTDPLVIYSRKTGAVGVALSGAVPQKAVVLRSRRD